MRLALAAQFALAAPATALACSDDAARPRVAVVGWSDDGSRLAWLSWEETGWFGVQPRLEVIDVHESEMVGYRALPDTPTPRSDAETERLLVEGIHGRDLNRARELLTPELTAWLEARDVTLSDAHHTWRGVDREAFGDRTLRLVMADDGPYEATWRARFVVDADDHAPRTAWTFDVSRHEARPTRWTRGEHGPVVDESPARGAASAWWQRTLAVETLPSPDGRFVAVTVRRMYSDGCWTWDDDTLRVIALHPGPALALAD